MLHKISDDALQSPHTTAPVLFNCNQHRSAHQSVLFRIIPVVLYGINRKVNTFAFLDEGSSLTLMDNSLADELNLTGPKEQLCLKWTGQTHRVENNSKIVSADISASNNEIKYALRNIRTVKSLNLPEQSLHLNELKQKHPHLRSIPIQSYEHAAPRILIGLDNWKLSFPLKAREGQEKEPAATKTRLGWVVFGGNDQTPQDFRHYHICECERNNESLHNMMKEYFSLDSLGVSTQVTVRSAEEERAIQMLESQTIRKGDRFQTPLFWKYDDIQLPNSYPMAKRRYECLRKKLSKDSTLADNINLQIKTYLEKGYIRKLSDVDLRKEYSRIWYLPIFTVININKPGKLRIVWDAAAKVEGIALNSMLSKGPDQLSSLLSVLFKFRERRIGICGDIREMFHQVLVCEDNQHVQRFLWSEDGFDRKPDVYVMHVLTFGATCSLSCAQFAKNKNAQEFEQKFPRAVKSILENHYVDDLLDSVDTETEAIQLAKEIRDIHSKCGFEIRNWVSYSPKVIKELGGKQRDSKIINVNPEVESTERVLGMYWCTSSDSFTFILSPKSSLQDIINTDTRPTKRQVLRVMMTIFDPLGLIAHFIVYIKILMQDIWRASLDWDDPILDEHYRNWCNWVSLLKNIHNIRIPRCYLKYIQFGDQEDLQLHVFVDASENAFAAVAFLRVSKGIEVECSIVTSKTRVAPLKMASIPRLELEAARLGARLAKTILKAHNIIVSKQFFWSDSRTVLSWIKSDHRKYRQFVAFRVSEILDMTDMNQWRYVPSKENVADDATKWSRTPDFGSSSRWFNGPPFLKQDEDKWPRIISSKLTTEDLRAHVLYHTKVQQNIFQVERFSSWWKLLRVVALVYRFLWNSLWAKKRCAAKRTGFIEKCEYLKAENCLFRQAQSSYYCDEISIFQNNKCLPIGSKVCLDKSSPLYKMSPYLDEEGVLRSHGRIDAAIGINSSVKRPILLPKDHYITRLIVNSYHLRFHHQNNETVVNELRQRFVIPRLRVVVKIIKRDCQACKNQRAKPRPPEMAQLPLARLASFTRPFTFVGLDYFGPMTVTMGRRTEKRWGVLLTCLTTRAIHIEVAGSLSSDSCILAIKRFIARRGVPNEIRCDNGTNFHGVERELREVTEKQNKQLADEFSSSVTKWIFNPPAAPHMGGSWERLVQSVKKTLKQIMPTRNPNDELLYSMLVETERTINTRPLTYLPLDSEGDEALTPNHFLLGSSNGEKPDGILCDGNILMKRNWTNAQKFANSFWKRWVREYLPDLTHRTKWYNQVKPIEKGDVVIIVDENNPRNTWPKGRILQTTTGKDGQVRKAVVQTSTGIYIRPAVLDVFKNSKSDDTTDIPGGSVGNDATTDIEYI